MISSLLARCVVDAIQLELQLVSTAIRPAMKNNSKNVKLSREVSMCDLMVGMAIHVSGVSEH